MIAFSSSYARWLPFCLPQLIYRGLRGCVWTVVVTRAGYETRSVAVTDWTPADAHTAVVPRLLYLNTGRRWLPRTALRNYPPRRLRWTRSWILPAVYRLRIAVPCGSGTLRLWFGVTLRWRAQLHVPPRSARTHYAHGYARWIGYCYGWNVCCTRYPQLRLRLPLAPLPARLVCRVGHRADYVDWCVYVAAITFVAVASYARG